jgi:hypothetical protein
METIYQHPVITSWFIFSIGFWLTAAMSQVGKKKD